MSARTSVSMATSAGKNAACPRSASMTRSVSRPPRSSMSETTTKAPSRASRRAIARPEPPPPAPVTIATLPLSSMLHPLASLAYHDRRLKRRSAIRVFPVGLRSSGRADLSLRGRAEDQPCDQGGVFLVLGPGRSDGPPQFSDAAAQLVDGEAKLGRATRVQLALGHSRDAQVAAFAGMAECVAEKLALRRVNQRVRGERRRKRCRWTTRAEEDAASHDVMALPSQIVNDRAEGSSGQEPRCFDAAPHEFLGLLQVQLLGSMVGLLGNAEIHKLDPPPVDHCRRARWRGDDHQRRPSGMRPEAQCSVFQRVRSVRSSLRLGQCLYVNLLHRLRRGLREASHHAPRSLVPALDIVAFRGGGRLYPDSIRPALMCAAESPGSSFRAKFAVTGPSPVIAPCVIQPDNPSRSEERSSGPISSCKNFFSGGGCMYYSAKEAAAVKHYGQFASGLRGKKEDNREEKNVQQPIAMKAGPAFLFDLDGTLVDSVYQHVLAWREAREELGMELAGWRHPRRRGRGGGGVWKV